MQDGNGNSALHLACWAPVVNPKLSMSSRMPGMSPMDDAREAVPTVALLLEKGADHEIRNKRGRTSLYSAVAAKNLHAVRLLMAQGADVNAETFMGYTPLQLAESLDCDKELLALLRGR